MAAVRTTSLNPSSELFQGLRTSARVTNISERRIIKRLEAQPIIQLDGHLTGNFLVGLGAEGICGLPDPLLMVHDFAKIRPEPVLERRAMDAPPAWTLLFTGLITGIAVGVFGCFLLYLSGKVPPLQSQQTTPVARESAPRQVATTATAQAETVRPADQAPTVLEETSDISADDEADEANEADEADEESSIGLSFYDELRDYEVPINATPVPLAVEPRREDSVPARGGDRRLLQIGAFQQASSAQRQVSMLDDLDVAAFIKQETVPGGRVLHLVQAGPFETAADLNKIRSLLQVNDINSFPLDPR